VILSLFATGGVRDAHPKAEELPNQPESKAHTRPNRLAGGAGEGKRAPAKF
jgi:hypothetical protein